MDKLRDACIFPENKRIFHGDNQPRPDALEALPARPSWRELRGGAADRHRGLTYQASPREIDMVNAALYLRRPLLITGPPGVGKSSLAHAVAYELDLRQVLVWPITSRSTREHGLYNYDAVARFQEIALAVKQREAKALAKAGQQGVSVPPDDEPDRAEDPILLSDIGRFLRLGPLGTAFLRSQLGIMSVVLIDELDKSDIDLPNDLLHLFEEGAFEIPEIARLPEEQRAGGEVRIRPHGSGEPLPVAGDGIIRCGEFPLVIITSNGEREFPPAFLRRCLRLEMTKPGPEKLRRIVKEHLGMNIPIDDSGSGLKDRQAAGLLKQFLKLRDEDNKAVATDQLLNAVYLIKQGLRISDADAERLRRDILATLSEG